MHIPLQGDQGEEIDGYTKNETLIENGTEKIIRKSSIRKVSR